MAWIDVLYLTKQKFSNTDELERCIDVANQLDGMQGNADKNDERIQVIKQYLATEHILNRKTVGRMTTSMQNNIIQSLHKAIDKFYEIIDKFDIVDEKYDEYKFIYKQIMATDGLYIKNHKEVEDESMFDDGEGEEDEYGKQFKSFFDSLVELKKSEKNLTNILTFYHHSNLANINIENITDKTNVKFPDIVIAFSVIKTVCDVESHKNTLKTSFYKSIVKEYKSDANDSQFVTEIINKNKDYIDIQNEESYEEKIKSILDIFPDSDIAYDRLDNILDSQKWLQTNATEIAAAFKKKKIPIMNMRTAIKHVIDYYEDNHIMNKIIDSGNESDMIEYVDNAISTILKSYFDLIDKTYQAIEGYNNQLNEEFLIKKLKLKLKEYIKRWQDFLKSDIYQWNAKNIDNSCTKIVEELFKNNDYTLAPYGKTSKQKVFKDNINILDAIKSLVTAPEKGHYDSVIPYLASFNKPNTPIVDKINVESMVLRLIKDFILTDYKEKITTFKLADAFNAYYDVICNVIYNRDLNISESLIVEEYMFIYDYVVNEDVDMSSYFEKLAKKIETTAGQDVGEYVEKYAKYPDENTVDSSTNASTGTDVSTGAIQQIENQIDSLKQSAEELSKATSNYNYSNSSDF